MKQCPRCNSQLDDRVSYCNVCGFQFFQQPRQYYQAPLQHPTPQPLQPIQQPQIPYQMPQYQQQPIIQIPQFLPKKDDKKAKNILKSVLVGSVIINLIFLSLLSFSVFESKESSDDNPELQQDYDSLLEKYNSQQKNYTKLKENYNTLQGKYTWLNENFNSTQSNYTTLNESYNLLQSNYTTLDDNYNLLQTKYDTLQKEYNILESYYANETEVLNRKRKMYRVYPVTMDWKGYSEEWSYTIEWELSSYFGSLKRDHSINWSDSKSVLKFADCWEMSSFYDQNLQDSFSNDADLANAILDIVHAVEYKYDPEGIEDVRYPDETLIEGCGDCEDVAILYSAMLEGNGLDAVLILYDDHLQAGVYLEEPPDTYSDTAWYVTYNSKKYYISECTGDYNLDVGDMPEEYKDKTIEAIYDV